MKTKNLILIILLLKFIICQDKPPVVTVNYETDVKSNKYKQQIKLALQREIEQKILMAEQMKMNQRWFPPYSFSMPYTFPANYAVDATQAVNPIVSFKQKGPLNKDSEVSRSKIPQVMTNEAEENEGEGYALDSIVSRYLSKGVGKEAQVFNDVFRSYNSTKSVDSVDMREIDNKVKMLSSIVGEKEKMMMDKGGNGVENESEKENVEKFDKIKEEIQKKVDLESKEKQKIVKNNENIESVNENIRNSSFKEIKSFLKSDDINKINENELIFPENKNEGPIHLIDGPVA